MATFTVYEGKYTNHTSTCRHPVNSNIYKLVTFHPGGSGPFNLQIWEHKAPYTTPPTLIRQWLQGSADAPGPFGYGGIECLPDGSIYIDVAAGALTATDIQPSYRVEPGCCAPFTPTGTDPRVDALQREVDSLAAQIAEIESELSAISTGGGLSAEQVRVLNYLVSVYGPLLG